MKRWDSTGQGGKNVPYSVRNPLYFITGTYWTYGDIFNPSSYVGDATRIVWQDPAWNETREANEEEYGIPNPTKSFFDPCPPGWRLPVNGWVTGFVFGRTDTTNPAANFILGAEDLIGRGRGTGGTYFPNGFLNDKNNPDAQTIFFPSSGIRGVFDPGRGGGYYTSSTPGVTYGASFLFIGNIFYTSNYDYGYGRQDGMSVRCVKE